MRRMKNRFGEAIFTGASLLALLLTIFSARPSKAQFMDKLNKGLGKIKQVREATQPMSLDEEQGTGREVAAHMVAAYHLYKNDALTHYVNMVGQTVAAQSERQDVQYHFAVLDSDDINAFSAPGGYIFVTRGAVKLCEDESELAGALAHEVGHVAGKHVVHVLEHDKALRAGSEEAASHMKSSQYSDYFNKLAGVALVKIIDQGLAPADEYDADQRGAKYAHAAGYPADGLERFLSKLDQATNQGANSFWTRTHPPVKDRNDHISQFIASEKWDDSGRPKLANRFTASTKMLRAKA